MTEDKQTSGGFFTGLLFGAVAGAAGYFFFKTKDGQEAREKLAKEWENAKEEMSKSGVIQEVSNSLPMQVQHTIEHIVEPKVIDAKRLVKTTTIPRTAKKATPKKTVSKKFKGM